MSKDELKIKTPSVIAFERKIDPSDALMYSGLWEFREDPTSWKSITLREKAVRGTISNRLPIKNDDPAKLNAKIENANLQTVDIAALPSDCDTLKVMFTLKIIGNVGVPCACNDSEYRNKLKAVVEKYEYESSFEELSNRYAQNIANGRFLWRNRIGAEEVEVHVSQIRKGEEHKKIIFNAFKLSLRSFDNNENITGITDLADIIKQGFLNKGLTILEVTAYARMGRGQEVFPSQEFVEKQKSKGGKSKVLYFVKETAAIHSQKIGNAIRTIDTWYPVSDDNIGPIAVEPYGAVTSYGKAYRLSKDKADFFTLLDDWLIKNKIPNNNDQHYVIANLIRGGVFGESKKG